MAGDYLEAGQAIIERLTDTVSEALAVYDTGQVATLPLEAMLTPCLYVLYGGDSFPAGEAARAGSGAAQVVMQQWLIVVVVKFGLAGSDSSAAMALAGTVIQKVIESLSGWQPGERFRPMRRVGVGEPDLLPGYAEFPLMFETQLITRSP